MRHNWEKYQKRRRIREEWGRRMDAARRKISIGFTSPQYSRAVTEYHIVTKKIRRYYDWLFMFTGRRC
jgi:hypothetical protein